MVGRSTPLTDERALAKVAAAGLPNEVDPALWLAHPYALDDLFRVVCGTSIATIGRERAALRRLEMARDSA